MVKFALFVRLFLVIVEDRRIILLLNVLRFCCCLCVVMSTAHGIRFGVRNTCSSRSSSPWAFLVSSITEDKCTSMLWEGEARVHCDKSRLFHE